MHITSTRYFPTPLGLKLKCVTIIGFGSPCPFIGPLLYIVFIAAEKLAAFSFVDVLKLFASYYIV